MVCIEASLIPLPLNPRYGNFSNTICRPKIYRFVYLKCSQQTSQQETQKDSIFTEDETELINALIGIQGRGRSASPQQIKAIDRAVQKLELVKGVTDPTSSSLIDGRWQLMFTTRPGTASPIQRTFVGVNSFTVFQDVCLRNMESRISNIVKFSEAIGELKVEAEALIKDGKRIIFQFDRAAFSFKFLPFKVPYPVPFRLLGDEAKGWLDTTYMSKSGNIRISRGNKGTTFVLQKETEPRQKLLSAIATGRDVREVVEEFIETASKSEVELGEGEWLMLWSTQEVTESWLENASKGLMGKQIIRPDGDIKFVVDILFGFKFSMTGKYVKCGSNTYEVTMDDAAIIAGSYGIPQEMTTKFNIQLIYNDGKIRISRGYNNILFVYIRIDDE